MKRSTRRLLLLVVLVPFLVLGAGLVYSLGMSRLEGTPRDFWTSLSWATETLTTTGYGADAHWRHPFMVVFVMATQWVGVFLVFLVFPVYLVPFLEERFEARLPREMEEISGHVVIYRHGPTVVTLLSDLARAGLATVVIEESESEARLLVERRQRVVFRDLDEGALEAAHLEHARALIANGSDAENAAAILAARQLGFAGEVLALVEDPLHRHTMVLAGANGVFTPRHVLAAALAARATPRIAPDHEGAQQIGGRIVVDEVRIESSSPLAGRSLNQARIGAETGATVIGQWLQGDLDTHPTAATRIEPRGILVAVGRPESLDRLRALAGHRSAERRAAGVVVLGHGEVGSKVVELLRVAGEQVRVGDQRPVAGVDRVMSAFDRHGLEQLGVREARAVILALDSDAATLFATVVIRDLCPDVPVFARVSEVTNVQRIHRAGADLALSIGQVASKILAHRLLGADAVSIDPQLKVMKVGSAGLAGKSATELDLRRRTGCSVVLVERAGEVLTDVGPGFVFAAGDDVYLAGSEEATGRYGEEFGRGG